MPPFWMDPRLLHGDQAIVVFVRAWASGSPMVKHGGFVF
jgi:hypothetical protein